MKRWQIDLMKQNQLIEKKRAVPKPFLKWAGGKSKLLSYLRCFVPNNFNNYLEPFLGGGAFFFDLRPQKSILSDSNSELINCYNIVKNRPAELISALTRMPVNEDFYYELRSKIPEKMSELERAARLIYLNKTCYNGLYRVNKKGQFNTPFGRNHNVKVCNSENLELASEALKTATIIEGDFETVLLKYAQENDFVYLDPPYPAIGKFSDFKRYTKEFFNEEDHRRLARVIEEIDRRGCNFILSNPKHDLVTELYSNFSDFRKIDVEAPRFINCQGSRRGNVPEVLITNIPASEIRTAIPSNQIHG